MKFLPLLLVMIILFIRTVFPEPEIVYHSESKVIEMDTRSAVEEEKTDAFIIETRLIYDPVDDVYYDLTTFNTLTLEQLDNLKGIGPKTAELIRNRITEIGFFKSFDELLDVKGIGPKKLAQILEQSK